MIIVRLILYYHRKKRVFRFDSTNFCLGMEGLMVSKLVEHQKSGLARWKHKYGFIYQFSSYLNIKVVKFWIAISHTKQNKYCIFIQALPTLAWFLNKVHVIRIARNTIN